MPKQNRSLQLPTSKEEMLESIGNAAGEQGLKLKAQTSNQIILTEDLNLFGYTNPATVEISFNINSQGSSAHVVVHNFGWGPIQNNHCKKVLEQFCQSLLSFRSGGINTSHLI